MHLKKLALTNFKNYELTELEFSPKINCFVGNNGVGKTNILDAIHYLSLTKSFFNSIDSISIRHGEDYFIIQGTFVRDEEEDQIYCAFQKQKQKLLKRNGKEYQKLSDHVGRYPVVMISPADSALITEGSEDRRKFMNKIISQYSAEYLDSVLNLSRTTGLSFERHQTGTSANQQTHQTGLSAASHHKVASGRSETACGPRRRSSA